MNYRIMDNRVEVPADVIDLSSIYTSFDNKVIFTPSDVTITPPPSEGDSPLFFQKVSHDFSVTKHSNKYHVQIKDKNNNQLYRIIINSECNDDCGEKIRGMISKQLDYHEPAYPDSLQSPGKGKQTFLPSNRYLSTLKWQWPQNLRFKTATRLDGGKRRRRFSRKTRRKKRRSRA